MSIPYRQGIRSRRPPRWWASRWIAVLESLGLARRLERGKRYARADRVLSVEVGPGRVAAEVQGSRYRPYEVRFRIKRFTKAQWKKAIEALAAQAIFAAKLLAGEMPRNIEEAFQGAKLSLFPASLRDLMTECSCPDAVNPCKHIAAVHYVLAEQFESDPFLLFRLRGLDRDELLQELRSRRAAEAVGPRPVQKRNRRGRLSMDRFWKAGDAAAELHIAVGPPEVSAALLKRLGSPSFWKSHPEIRGALERLYAKVTERAMAQAYGGQGNGLSRDERADITSGEEGT